MDNGEIKFCSQQVQGSWAREVETYHAAIKWDGLPRSFVAEELNGGDTRMRPAEKPDNAAEKSRKKMLPISPLAAASGGTVEQNIERLSLEQSEESCPGGKIESATKTKVGIGGAHAATTSVNANRKGIAFSSERNASASSSKRIVSSSERSATLPATKVLGQGRVRLGNSVSRLKRTNSGIRSLDQLKTGEVLVMPATNVLGRGKVRVGNSVWRLKRANSGTRSLDQLKTGEVLVMPSAAESNSGIRFDSRPRSLDQQKTGEMLAVSTAAKSNSGAHSDSGPRPFEQLKIEGKLASPTAVEFNPEPRSLDVPQSGGLLALSTAVGSNSDLALLTVVESYLGSRSFKEPTTGAILALPAAVWLPKTESGPRSLDKPKPVGRLALPTAVRSHADSEPRCFDGPNTGGRLALPTAVRSSADSGPRFSDGPNNGGRLALPTAIRSSLDSGHRFLEGPKTGGIMDLPVSLSVGSNARLAFAQESANNGWSVLPLSAVSREHSGARDVDLSSQLEVGDSGYMVSGPNHSGGAAIATPDAVVPNDCLWDYSTPLAGSMSLESGREVTTFRRITSGEETSVKSLRDPILGPKGHGQMQMRFTAGENARQGLKQSSHEESNGADRVGQHQDGRPGIRNLSSGSSLESFRQGQSTQMGGWGRSLENPITDPQPIHSSYNEDTRSGSLESSSNILDKLLPRVRPSTKSNSGIPHQNGVSMTGSWKGQVTASSGNGLSVIVDYPSSLDSDSEFSDDDLSSDKISMASDSDESHSAKRMNKWFRNFFLELDMLTDKQLGERDRRWHCPACQLDDDALEWHTGLQTLLEHAKILPLNRVKLHRLFSEVLEEEIRIRRTPAGTLDIGEYGKWRGLADVNEKKDCLIVWPPMIIVSYTQLEQDESDKWTGMGNRELLDLFKNNYPLKVRHAYSPQGQCGISVLVFAQSPIGYYNARVLDKQFSEAHRGRKNWESSGKLLFQPGDDRILYAYMAIPEDLEIFNNLNPGTRNLEWDQKSLEEMVLSPLRKQDEENRRVSVLEARVQYGEEAAKTLKKTISVISKKLHLREHENAVIRDRAREQFHQQSIQLNDMDTLYKEKIEELKKDIVNKVIGLEQVGQSEQLEPQASKIHIGKNLCNDQQQGRALLTEEIARHAQLVEMCQKKQEAWEAKRTEMEKEHHKKMLNFKSRQWEELMKFELELDQEKKDFMESYKLCC